MGNCNTGLLSLLHAYREPCGGYRLRSIQEPIVVVRLLVPSGHGQLPPNHIVGNRLEPEDILSRVEPEDLQELIISDCVELAMPPQIQIFTNVYFVMIYNSTIVSRDMDAALTGTAHPNLMYLAILETELAAIPPALLHFQLPIMLTNIAFSGTNLTSIPDNCHKYWTSIFNIIIEASPWITEVPPSLTQMSWVARLSLVGNSISTITDDFSGENMFTSIDLSENPLQALPGTLGVSFGMANVSDFITTSRCLAVWQCADFL